jgi:hypothetical protein
MEPNPYYEENIPWTPHYPYQEQVFEYQEGSSFPPEPLEKYQKIQLTPRLPKAQTLVLIRNMKQSLFVISVVGFASFGWLIAAQSAITHELTTPSQFPYAMHHSNDARGFFDQQGGTQFGRHRRHHHHDFGQGQPPQGQDSGPISGTHVS